jgi:hypothetical protein
VTVPPGFAWHLDFHPETIRQTFDLTANIIALGCGHPDHNPQRLPASWTFGCTVRCRRWLLCFILSSPGFKPQLLAFSIFSIWCIFVSPRAEVVPAGLVAVLHVGKMAVFLSASFLFLICSDFNDLGR